MSETYEDQQRDSHIIFKAITSGDFNTFEEAQRVVAMLYVPDMSISRSGIAKALGKLKVYYDN